MNTPNIEVLQDTVVVKDTKEDIERTQAVLYLPETLRDKYITGVVILTGDEVTEVKTGDRVVFHRDVARRSTIMGDEVVLVKERNVFFKLVD